MSGMRSFTREREILQETAFHYAGKNMKRFFNLDTVSYANGELSQKQKELLGLNASLVLRCEDCISYHVRQCFNYGVTDSELEETVQIALVVGGSIVIPHLRKIFRQWEELKNITEEDFSKSKTFAFLSEKFKEICLGPEPLIGKLKQISVLLDRFIPYYNWSGFYLSDSKQDFLHLGPYQGAPTEHTKIAFGQGICGQAASTKASVIIGDVQTQTNYLACSLDVKSEIVVPIMAEDGRLLGEIDIDAHILNAFDDDDKIFLENLARLLSKNFSKEMF